MKSNFFHLISTIALTASLLFSSCTKDSDPQLPEVSIDQLTSESLSVAQDEILEIKAKISSTLPVTVSWSVNGNAVDGANLNTYSFSASEVGQYTVTVVVDNGDGQCSASVQVSVYGKYRDGVFILNEGNMTSENGFISFIDQQGKMTDSVYYKVNGKFLGNSLQNLYIADNKLYVIAQNGNRMDGEGFLTIANAETLKKIESFNDELSTLSWPTHVAVVDGTVYIRDNAGVYSFAPSTKTLTFIEGSKGALKNHMAVIGKRVFVPASKAIYVIENSQIVSTISLPAAVSGVLKASDGNLWVSCTSSPATIMKINPSDYSIIKTNSLPTEAKVGAGWGVTPGICAIGDTLYFCNASTTIYRHIFSTQMTDKMCNVKDEIENAAMAYNNPNVNPKNGEVYFTSIKGYGTSYLTNDISVWTDNGNALTLKTNYQDHTHFPAGVFFTDSYK